MRRLVVAITFAIVAAGTGVAAASGPADETPQPPRKQEVLRERTSGYWTSNRPTKHAYRWRMLGIGVGLLGVTGFVMLRLVKRANAERAARDRAQQPT